MVMMLKVTAIDFCKLTLYLANLMSVCITFNYFLLILLYPMYKSIYKYILSPPSNSYNFFFFISDSIFQDFQYHVKSGSKSGHPELFHDFKGNASKISAVSMSAADLGAILCPFLLLGITEIS